jgi:hypothetical protein
MLSRDLVNDLNDLKLPIADSKLATVKARLKGASDRDSWSLE